MGHRVCQLDGCDQKISADRQRFHAKYCSAVCGNRGKGRRLYAREKMAAAALVPVVDADGMVHEERARRGRTYDTIREHRDWLDSFRQGWIDESQLAALAETDVPTVHQALAAITIDELTARRQSKWKGPNKEAREALDDFVKFRNRYFRTGEGRPYETTPFHRRWIQAILDTMNTGGRLMILSPPRHGKTQLLLHFCVWQIIRNPHICIVWVAGNKELAMDWTASLEEEFETNQRLISDFLPPGGTFKPTARSRRSWARQQFTVDTRTQVVKSPTFVASSRGTKILSRDTDILIADDVEDHPSTIMASNREQTRNWWSTDVTSRKEAHTAFVVIGSRQHPDDLYGHLLESEAWTSIIETAHAEECDLNELDLGAHVDCMLWPGRHPYSWLIDQLDSMITTGGRGMWEMIYLNRPVAEGLMLFDRDQVLAARDTSRGLYSYPGDSILIAGLDPSGTGYQASFLWAYQPSAGKLFMVDTENEEGGGIARAREQISYWFDGIPDHAMFCRRWVVEENLYKMGIVKDEILGRYCRDNMIELTPHQTGVNKWDSDMGVSAINSWFTAGLVSLPYRDTAAQRKTDAYIRQLLNFSSNATRGGRRRNPKSDLVMASWFPFPQIQFLDRSRPRDMEVQYAASFRGMTSRPMFSYTRKTQP